MTAAYDTRDDFRHIDIDHRRWQAGQWIVVDMESGRWVKGPKFWPDFAAQHPKNYAEIKADAETWMPKVPT